MAQGAEKEKFVKRFRGQSEHALDAKGRLNIPARFQEVLREGDDERLMVIAWDNCLKAYPVPEWDKLEVTLQEKMKEHPGNIKMMKHMIGGVVECSLKQGRILLPPRMREGCGISKDVVLQGSLQIFEIWDKNIWERMNKPTSDEFQEFSQKLSQFGLF